MAQVSKVDFCFLLTEMVALFYNLMKGQTQRLIVSCGIVHHNFVFSFREKPISNPGGVKRSFRTACKNAKIPCGRNTENGLIMHDIRRTVKTNMLNAGVDKVHRDWILGRSLKGMDVHYLTPDDNTLRQAMDKFTRWIDDQFQNVDQNDEKRKNANVNP